jgi:hypothetical protein
MSWYLSTETPTTNLDHTWVKWIDETYDTSTPSSIYYISETGRYVFYKDQIWNYWNAPKPDIITSRKSKNSEEQIRKEAEERKRKQKEIQERAEALLLENLTLEQQEMYKKLKKFRVVSETGKRYEIECNGRQYHNIFELNKEGKRVIEHCIYATRQIPRSDNYLAQKLLLEGDEKRFRRVANQTRLIRA